MFGKSLKSGTYYNHLASIGKELHLNCRAETQLYIYIVYGIVYTFSIDFGV